MLVPAKALDLFLLLLAASKLRQRCNATQGLDAAHPRYGAAAALLSGGLRHARCTPPHGDDAAGVARAVTIDGEACVVTERCGRASAASAPLGPRPLARRARPVRARRGPRGAGRRRLAGRAARQRVPAQPRREIRLQAGGPSVLAALEGGLAEAYAQRAAARGSLLPRLVGAYTVERGGETTHWLATTNVFGCRPGGCVAVRDKYDVKGSTAGRRTRPRSGTLKDLDALDDADALRVRGSERVLAALEADTALLADLGLLDYSLLLGVMETPTRGLSPRRRRCAQSVGRARGPRGHAGFPRRRVATLEYEEKTMFEPGRDLVETTLDEPVRETIMRDLREVGAKLKLVILPRVSQEGVLDRLKEWDLWGPSRSRFAAVFVVVWVGAAIVTLNAQLLGGRISFFQSVCILGYSIFPLNVGALLCLVLHPVTKSLLLRALVVGVCFAWSTRVSVVFFGEIIEAKRRALAIYPVFGFYSFIAWMILIQK
ncbi:hypothetical protein JL722_9570 [Aureococcus anophagefferens]|nr:hypothetical protein JL722_9570 [Aureococcus anophagefferens]